jgi:hypothetical protein
VEQEHHLVLVNTLQVDQEEQDEQEDRRVKQVIHLRLVHLKVIQVVTEDLVVQHLLQVVEAEPRLLEVMHQVHQLQELEELEQQHTSQEVQ